MVKKHEVIPWDPWPVQRHRTSKDPVLKAAQRLVRRHNHTSVDNLVDRIVVLPASSQPVPEFNGARPQGGSERMRLYSIRSPSTLPVKVFLWQTPDKKVMVRSGLQNRCLESFISSWGSATVIAVSGPNGFCKHYRFWRSIMVNEKWLETIPKHLHQPINERWWMVNGFRYLGLPFELREMIVNFAMGPFAEPFALHHEREASPLTPRCSLTAPNMSLTLVNKQLHFEAVSAMYARTTFVFRSNTQFRKFLFGPGTPFPTNLRPSRHLVRHIELQMNASCLLLFLGLCMHRGNVVTSYECSSFCSRFKSYNVVRSILIKQLSLRYLRIRIPHVREYYTGVKNNSICQKTFCLAFWAAGRGFLSQIPRVEFTGHVDSVQKEDWMAELHLERKGILPDPSDLLEWKNQTLKAW